MAEWEYESIRCGNFDVRAGTFERDPDFDWDALAKADPHPWLVWGPNGWRPHWLRYLNDLGDQGWELVGATPSLDLLGGVRGGSSVFSFLLKRTKS